MPGRAAIEPEVLAEDCRVHSTFSFTATYHRDVRAWTYEYDRVAGTTTITGPDGGETVFAYKDPNYPSSLDDSSDRGAQWDRGLIHTITNPDGSVTYGTGSDQRVFSYAWNYKTGNLISWADDDNSVTTSYLYDGLGRRTSESQAGSRKTITEYDDSNLRVTEKRDLDVFGDGKLQSVTRYDQLGRVTRVNTTDGSTLTPSDETDGIKVRTDHKTVSGGQMTISSTPYRQETGPTVEWTCVQQDSIGRTKAIGVFKGSTRPASCTATANRTGLTEFSYDRNTTRITEKAPDGDVVRDETRDALGRLTEVTEDPGAGNLAYGTAYTYDPLDNLLTVTQGVQTRTFVYSSLGLLLSADTPESALTRYVYPPASNWNLETRSSGIVEIGGVETIRVVTTFAYDTLKRETGRTYSDGTPALRRSYYLSGETAPNVGQLKLMASSSSQVGYVYDSLGRVKSRSQTIAGHPDTFTFTNAYYLNDALKTQTYPSGRMITYDVDDAGRVEDVSDGTTTYADMPMAAAAYHADGRLRQMMLGNNLWVTRDYRTPGTTTQFKLGAMAGSDSVVGLDYNYSGTENNGNLQSHRIRYGATTWEQSFTYDKVNRLATASETSGYSRTFGYDRYGNRWVPPNTNPGMVADESHEPRFETQFDATKNQIKPPPMVERYDTAGNQILYSPYALVYDAENRLISMTSPDNGFGTFLYDGDGRRVKKTWTLGGGTAADTYYVYDIGGNLAAEYGTASNPNQTTPETVYPFTDMLGSVRTITGATGNIVKCYDYLPFGRLLSSSDNLRETLNCHPSEPDMSLDTKTSQKFTGQIRDEETLLDYFGARYFSSAQGRFLSPDNPFADRDASDPQSWNIYAYTRNNPLRYVDRNGEVLETWWDAVNVGVGIASFIGNVRQGNAGAAAVDAVGVVADSIATAVPFVPGGAGTIIRSARAVDKAADLVEAAAGARKLENVADGAGAASTGGGKGRLNIFRFGDETSTQATGWREGDRFLSLPNQGSARANWKQNSSRLREEMRRGEPISDSYRTPSGAQIPSGQTPTDGGRFLRAERELLDNQGWRYDPRKGAYYPPAN